MLLRNFVPTATLAMMVFAQPADFTARELFFVPAEILAQKNPAIKPPARKPKSSGGAAQAKVAPKEIRTPTEIKVITTDYSGPRPLGLRYSVLKLTEGRFAAVNVDRTFYSGDAIKVRVDSNEDGFLYVFSRKSTGTWEVLFPNPEIRGGNNAITAGEKYDLPSPEQKWTLYGGKGEERLYVVLSRKPLDDLEKRIYELAGQPKDATPKRVMRAENLRPIDDRLVGQLQAQMLTRDLILEKVDEPSASADIDEAAMAAFYAVDKSGKVDASVAAEIRLKHE